jgi:predicted phage baseplate assembly protein
VVSLDKRLVPNTAIEYEAADIRRLRFHEAVSPRLTLRAPTQWTSGAFPDTRLNFFGTLAEALALKGRSLLLLASDGRFEGVNVQEELPSLTGAADSGPRMWEIELDRAPGFTREDFDELNPTITVYGNLVPATQGKTQTEAPIGSGDSRQTFQSLPLAKSPLTYLLDGAATPPQRPELTVWVGGVEWDRVDTLFGAGADDKVYVVREDQKGASWVQFGDGVMGSVLPSGRNNVVAKYRTGVGAAGEAIEEPKAGGRLTGLDKVYLPSPVVGGAQAETQATARVAAPGRMQSLGRLVGLEDYDAEALTIPGVIKTRALWVAPGAVPRIRIVVLTESGSDADLEYVRETMATYNRCKGPSRYPIDVVGGVRSFVQIALTVGYDPARRPEDIVAGVQKALTEDLFGLENRQFGESAHKSQILGYAQQVDGVRWVLADPAGLSPLGCLPAQILALNATDLQLSLVADDRTEACS